MKQALDEPLPLGPHEPRAICDDIRRLILLSDGNANQGITDPTSIAEIAAKARREGITISTLGVGVDFNEDLMTLVAQSGAGGYYYARDASAVAAAFVVLVAGVIVSTSLYLQAQAARVEAELQADRAGAAVTEARNSSDRDEIDGRAVEITDTHVMRRKAADGDG